MATQSWIRWLFTRTPRTAREAPGKPTPLRRKDSASTETFTLGELP